MRKWRAEHPEKVKEQSKRQVARNKIRYHTDFEFRAKIHAYQSKHRKAMHECWRMFKDQYYQLKANE